MSDCIQMHFGVGQVMIIGPLIFKIMINDIYGIAKSCTLLGFADDTTMNHGYHHIILYARVKHDLKIWFKANKLSMNVYETKCVFFPKFYHMETRTCA